MNYLLILVIVIAMSLQGVAQKQYNRKTGNKCAFLYSGVSMAVAALFFLITSGGKLSFEIKLLPYCLAFALFFGMSVLFTFFAVREGSLSFTSLATSYSLIIPTLSGIVLYDESVSTFFYFGLAALLVSLVLINEYKDGKKFTLKWIVYVLLAFIGNGMCSTVQTYQQHVFDGKYKSELMIIALLTVSAVLVIISLCKERKDIGICIRKGAPYMALYGIKVALVNLLVMVLSRKMNVSIMFPLISGGGLIATSLVSIVFYKERLTKKQYFGLLLGVIAVVLINI
ncbi:MAG: EamA family transporter [Clostridia bacterium]|nr:EamA family transporter [Clostridia bacterium]